MFDDFPSMFGSKAHKIRGTWAPMIGSFYYSADIEEDDKDLSEFDSLKNSKSLASKALKKAMQDGLFDTVLKKDAILKRDAILSKINARNRAVEQERFDRELADWRKDREIEAEKVRRIKALAHMQWLREQREDAERLRQMDHEWFMDYKKYAQTHGKS